MLKYFHALKGPIIGALTVATPAVLCHKEPARRKNTDLFYQRYFDEIFFSESVNLYLFKSKGLPFNV